MSAATHFVPCVRSKRACYPGVETCYDHRYCILEPWIVCIIYFFLSLCCLGLSLSRYHLILKRGKWTRRSIPFFGVLTFTMLVATIWTPATRESQVVKIPQQSPSYQDFD